MPTSRRQNIITNPATAANTDARGIRVSGPIYKTGLSVSVTGPNQSPCESDWAHR